MSFDPVVPNLLPATTAVERKYGPTSQYLDPGVLSTLNAQFAPSRAATTRNAINPLILYDLARASRGLSPLGARQSAAALQTLATGKPATAPRKEPFYKNVLRNMKELVAGIPHLPMGIYNEVRDLPEALGDVGPALARGDNPFESLGNVANLPGFRMIPGSYIAGAFGEEGGGVQQLTQNPLFTFLDALPVASAAASTTKVARAAKTAHPAQVKALVDARRAEGWDPSTAIIPSKPRPLQTALTRRLDSAGEVVPNTLGRGVQGASELFGSTAPGRAIQATFKERASARIFNRGDQFLREASHIDADTASLRPPVPGGAAAIADPLAIRDLSINLQRDLRKEGLLPDTPEMQAFFQRVTTSELPDGTPLPPEQMVDLPPSQRALVRQLRDFQVRTASYTDNLPGSESTRTLTIDGTPEVFDYRTGVRVSKAQNLARDAREIAEARQAALDPSSSPLTPADIQARLDDVIQRRAAGTIKKSRADDLISIYEQALKAPARPDIARIIPTLRPLTKVYPTIPRLIDNLQNGRWGAVNRDLRALSKTRIGQTLPFDLAQLRGEVSDLVRRDRALSRTAHVDESYAARAEKVAKKVEDRAVSPRFQDLVQREAKKKITDRVRTVFATDPDLNRLIELADNAIYDTIQKKDPRFVKWVREDKQAASMSWKAIRDAGHDPIYFQRVTREQARRQPYARISDKILPLQSVRARMQDATPYVEDVGISLNQASLDILQRLATTAALDDIGKSFGRTHASLVEEYTERGIPDRATLDARIKQRWVKWTPEQWDAGKGGAAFAIEGADDIWVPLVMSENIQRMFTPPLPKLTAAFDPIMNVFRTSVLPLALRWQLNNAVGGAIVTAVTDPRAFLELPSVIRQLWGERKNVPEASERFASMGAPPSGLGLGADPEIMRYMTTASSPIRDRIAASAQFASGTTLRKLADAARDSRLAKIPEGFKKGVEMSYHFNQFVDDVYRGINTQSTRKALAKKGYSADAIEAMAASNVRRVFQAWDEMTPMERSVMRSIMPFYGFAAYATRFVLKYPFDHPLRVSVLNSITQAELEDAMTGLPDYIREMILLGDPRANGVVRALNVGPFNPFGGVPSNFTVAGFLGQMNPVITGVLESVGMDVRQGGPQLFPELRYDPESGRLVADPGGNAISNIFGSITPQVQGIYSLLGWNDEFNKTLQRDPGAAGRMLLSNFGMPILYRDIDIGEQLIKSEMARFDDQETARKEALTTGDLGILDDFPGLKGYAEQIRALESAGVLDQMRTPNPAAGVSGPAAAAYALQAAINP